MAHAFEGPSLLVLGLVLVVVVVGCSEFKSQFALLFGVVCGCVRLCAVVCGGSSENIRISFACARVSTQIGPWEKGTYAESALLMAMSFDPAQATRLNPKFRSPQTPISKVKATKKKTPKKPRIEK